MEKRETDARERILKAAAEILREETDIEKITVRQIAERANVGVGSINYHFDSKDKLLSMAVGDALAEIIKSFSEHENNDSLSPVERLKNMLEALCGVALSNEKLSQFMLTQDIMNGNMQAPLYLIPALREIFGTEKGEIELRVAALQIIQPLQIAGISPKAFRVYSGIDLYDTKARSEFIDMLIDNLMK